MPPTGLVTTPTPGPRTPAELVSITDGDTIKVRVGGQTYSVRYIGMDTPETVHPARPVECFGPEATAANQRLLMGKRIELEKDISETDQYGRLLRYVWAGGELINERLVRDGYAAVSTYPPDVKYQQRFLAAQQDARQAGRGLWGSCNRAAPPSPPLSSRPPAPPPVPPSAPPVSGCPEGCVSPPAGCAIKGNISSSGERIYHVPGGEFYNETVISPRQGELWFCTEREAANNGWRRSLR